MLEINDIINLHYNQIIDFSVAPDNSMIAYVIGSKDVPPLDYMNNICNRTIRLVDMASKQDVEVISKVFDGHAPAFSNSGNQIAFLGRDSYKTQIYLYDLQKNQAQMITQEDYNCLNAFDRSGEDPELFWSPDDSKVAVLFFPNGNRYYLSNIAPKLQQRIVVKTTNTPREQVKVNVSILVLDVRTGLTCQLLQDNTCDLLLHGFIDDKNLLITINGKISKIDLSTGRIEEVYHTQKNFLQITDFGLYYADVKENTVEFGKISNNNLVCISEAAIKGESIKPVGISFDGNGAYFVYNQGMFSYLIKLLSNGHVYRISDPNDIIYEPGVQAQPQVLSNGKIACVISNFKNHHELFILQDGAKEKQTNLNSVVKNCKVKVSISSFKSGGIDVETIIVLPEDYGSNKKYPALIYLHGGPRKYLYANLANIINSRAESAAVSLAQAGYIVALPAYRGSKGYGKEFINFIKNPMTDLEVGYEDALACGEHLINNFNADRNRLGIYGSSYGAHIVGWALTHSDMFACGAGIIGVNYDQIFFNKLASSSKDFWIDNNEKYRKYSIAEDVHNISVPVLIIETGEAEGKNFAGRVFFNALSAHEKQAEWVTYPYAFHGGGWTDEYKYDYINRLVTWFNSHCMFVDPES